MEKTSSGSMSLFPCPGCNAQLYYKPGTQEMDCEYCGTHVAINNSTEPLALFDLKSHLSPDSYGAAAVEKQVYKCTHCGAEKIYTTDLPSWICGFCDFEVVNPVAFKTRTIQPSAIIPFKVNEEQALEILREWLDNSTAPAGAKKLQTEIKLRGLYLPFWTISSQADTEWSGEAGRHYYVTHEEKDRDGNKVIHREQKTEWSQRSGTNQEIFKDVLVKGSTRTTIYMDAVMPYDLKELANYNESYISGFDAQVYDIPLQSAYEQVSDDMNYSIKNSCISRCEADTYRSLVYTTVHSNQTFKLIMLPIWMGTIAYKEKNYDFRINGQTGKIDGKIPEIEISGWTVFIILVIIFIILVIIGRCC